MDETWWPTLLAHVPRQTRWDERDVVVAEYKTVEGSADDSGERRSYTVLVPMTDLDVVLKNLAKLDTQVETSGPFPVADAAGVYHPKFWIGARDLPRDRYEPLVLAWTANNTTTLAPSPGFLMTYALAPRNVGQATHYDDVTGPVRDVVQVSAPSVYSVPTRTEGRVTIARDYLADYLTLRGTALVEVYFEIAWGKADQDALDALAGRKAAEFQLNDRLIALNNDRPDHFCAQVWGARIIARPSGLPISDDPLKKEGLRWPGFAEPINKERAAKLRVPDFAYVKDAVLGTYEGAEDFDVSPLTGGVRYGAQWGVSFIDRIGRDLLRLELKKLYEGAPAPVIRHWHGFAVPAPAQPQKLRDERNIAIRARELVDAFLELGDELAGVAALLGAKLGAEDFTGLERADLKYRGWWNGTDVEPITRHAPLDMSRDAFLERCVSLSNLVIEGLSESRIRMLVDQIGVPAADTAKLRTLKLLDIVVRVGQVANSSGLKFGDKQINLWERLTQDGTTPAQPLDRLFALNDLRQVKSHKKKEAAETMKAALERYDLDPARNAAGYGAALDAIYDQLINELQSVAGTLRKLNGPVQE